MLCVELAESASVGIGMCDCRRDADRVPPMDEATVYPPAEGVGEIARFVSGAASVPPIGSVERKKSVSVACSSSSWKGGADDDGFRSVPSLPILRDGRPDLDGEGAPICSGAGMRVCGELGLGRAADADTFEVAEKAGEAERLMGGAVKLREAGREYEAG